MRRAHHTIHAATLAWVCGLAACGNADHPTAAPTDAGTDVQVEVAPPPPPQPRKGNPDAIFVDGRVLRDGRGRQVLFRGYNTKINGIFDVTFSDGRTPNYTFPDFDEAGATRFEQLGFNVTRLTINWSALEPTPGAYSASFFTKLDALFDMARRHHFHVLLDMHQDAYSKEIGEDGQPLWAITPPPPMLLSGPSDDSRRESAPVINAFLSFFGNQNAQDGRPVQDAYAAAIVQMLNKHVGEPLIIGVEAMNEPVAFNLVDLFNFHTKIADAVHSVDGDLPLFFEPNGTRNQWDTAATDGAPWVNGPGVYAPHIYTAIFSIPDQMGWASEDPTVLAPSMQKADAEAAAWTTPMFVTEFGCDQTVDRGPMWLAAEYDLQDKYMVSSTVWGWEPGSWSIRPDAGVAGRPATVKVVSRPYPRAIAGDLLQIERPALGQLRIHYRPTARTMGLPHEISASADYFTDVHVKCDGVDTPYTPYVGRLEVVCPATDSAEHLIDVVGTPTP